MPDYRVDDPDMCVSGRIETLTREELLNLIDDLERKLKEARESAPKALKGMMAEEEKRLMDAEKRAQQLAKELARETKKPRSEFPHLAMAFGLGFLFCVVLAWAAVKPQGPARKSAEVIKPDHYAISAISFQEQDSPKAKEVGPKDRPWKYYSKLADFEKRWKLGSYRMRVASSSDMADFGIWVVIVPENIGEKPELAAIATQLWLDQASWSNWHSTIYSSMVYTKEDVAVGYSPRGKVVAKYSENYKEAAVYVLDMKLESGKDQRVFVSRDVFEKAEIGRGLLPKEIYTPPVIDGLSEWKGWMAMISTARQDLYYFIPSDTEKEQVLVSVRGLLQNSYNGSEKEPVIKSDFGPCPAGKVKKLFDCSGYYFVDVENEKETKRYKTDKTFYDLLKIGDKLPIGE